MDFFEDTSAVDTVPNLSLDLALDEDQPFEPAEYYSLPSLDLDFSEFKSISCPLPAPEPKPETEPEPKPDLQPKPELPSILPGLACFNDAYASSYSHYSQPEVFLPPSLAPIVPEPKTPKFKKPKSRAPVQKLTSEIRNALKACDVILFPRDFVVKKKISVYLRNAFQLFAEDLCTSAERTRNDPLLSMVFQVCFQSIYYPGDDAYKFLLGFFKSTKQVATALNYLNIFEHGFKGHEFNNFGVAVIRNIISFYKNQLT